MNQDLVVADTANTSTDIHARGIIRPDTVTEVTNHVGGVIRSNTAQNSSPIRLRSRAQHNHSP